MDKDINLSSVVKKLKKKYASIRIAGEDKEPLEYISTGNRALDIILEGGVALGYVSEWSGGSGAGKTLLLQIMAGNMQREYNSVVIWLDRENAWFNKRAEDLGISLKDVILFKPQDIPTVQAATEALLSTLEALPPDIYKFIAIDSISAFDKEGAYDKADMGKKAKSIHEMFRKLLPIINDRTSLHFSNQRTFKIGILFGPTDTTTGGEGPKFYATYRIKLDDIKPIFDTNKGKEIIGHWIDAQVIKTRTGPNYRKVRFPFFFKEGIPYNGGYLRMLSNRNIVVPKNKADFQALNRHDLVYKGDVIDDIKDMDTFMEKYPELIYTEYPEYSVAASPLDTEEEDDE